MGFLFSKPIEVDMDGPVAAEVRNLITSDKVVIFSKTYCPYCDMAKKEFNNLDQKYTVIELNKRDDGDVIQAILGEITGGKTVPRVFIKGQCIGGGSETKSLAASGKLKELLA
ncbi:hypothetical protein B566_EDAN008017 [Ephemera danica]|nr:hypothetical protein B566_EDAN008017 [Ephemera danica]